MTWILREVAQVPDSYAEMRLYQRDKEFSIRVERDELMNSYEHNSEDVLAQLACEQIGDRKAARVLIGGLGMGFTLAAALQRLQADATIVVAELMPEVIRWNYAELGELAGNPLADPRVSVVNEDVGLVMQRERDGFDAIILDVDNGPKGFTRGSNDTLYGRRGLATAHDALRAGGVLTVWSAKASKRFVDRLRSEHFKVKEVRTRSLNVSDGAHHTVWVAVRA